MKKIKRFLMVLLLFSFVLPFMKITKRVNADEIKADILDFKFSEGTASDESGYDWNVILSQTPTFEKAKHLHLKKYL